MGSIYERELKGILTGSRDVLEKSTKTCSATEKGHYLKTLEKPFVVVRAAGSLGTADIVVLRNDVSFVVEIKSSSYETIRFTEQSSRLQEQAIAMKRECERAGVLALYAYRLKGVRGDSWRIFTLDLEMPPGRNKVLHSRIPKLDRTRENNYIMRWKEGMPLSDFLNYLSS